MARATRIGIALWVLWLGIAIGLAFAGAVVLVLGRRRDGSVPVNGGH
jgi:hypothetical protein